MIPTGVGGGVQEIEARERAERETQRLQEELKKAVKASAKDVGTLRKELAVTVPGKVITSHLEFNFDELRQDAFVPGFRKGHAPLQLIQKRYGSDVRNSLKTSIIVQSFLAAMEQHQLDALGDPLFRVKVDGTEKLLPIDEAGAHVKLPDAGDFEYVCEVEVKPKLELPELKGIPIRAPDVEITDDDVEQFILRQRKIRGRYEPLTDASAGEPDDQVITDVALTVEGVVVKSEENVQLGVRATRLDGVPLPTLGDVLKGVRPGDSRSVECEIPADYERPDLRGKKGRFEFKVQELKRLAPMPLEAFVAQVGAESEAQLRQFVRDDLASERDRLVLRAKKDQVFQYLLDHVPIDLPSDFSARMTDRAVVRKIIDLSQSGVPDGEIDARIDELRTSAGEETARELRLEFIFEKVAEKLGVSVTDEEVNSEIARIARLYHRRFDRVRDDLARRGLLPQLAEQIRQDKCVEILLRDAKEVEAAEAPAEGKKKPRARKPKEKE
ncbi:MAG: trigger factor [Phycisphaerae bacterium]|nr:trigger factor [Phycisphaerae bacterium]MCZ2400228.1 trigger factor [Phycisphaerae bacterium]NUQ49475.1 trigger factor [Phycisphaerae bacterium]